MGWFYLSFASRDQFLGACVVEAASAQEAPLIASARGINPGGQVLILSSDGPGPLPPYRLFSRAALNQLLGDGGATMGELLDRGFHLPADALVVTDPREIN